MSLERTYQNHPILKAYRKFLRGQGTLAERTLWKYLRRNQLGFKFRRQFSIENIIADFYCHELRLIIELDGWTHESEKSEKRDIMKERVLESKNYRVIRFTNEEIYGDIEKVINSITRACEGRAK